LPFSFSSPESWTGLKIGDKVRLPVFTFCCPGCGFLESYAQIKPE
jgi:hypothetical protein